jgi:hypothetical protein
MAWTRDTPWRQGSIIAATDAVALKLVAEVDRTSIGVVVSHDCDLAVEDLDEEPDVEVMIGRRVEMPDGQLMFAKHPRRLVLEFAESGKPLHVELLAARNPDVPKLALASYKPDDNIVLPDHGRKILARWLAARYQRQALPDDLVDRLRPVLKKFEKVGKSNAAGVIGYWLDYDPRSNTLPENEPYELWVNVVYAADRPEFAEQAAAIAAHLKAAITGEFHKHGRWQLIDLRRCEPVSEAEFPLSEMRRTVEYKLEHLSLKGGPNAPMAP